MTTYLRCRRCGWVHFAAAEGRDQCFRCGTAVAELEPVDVLEIPAGVGDPLACPESHAFPKILAGVQEGQ